MQLPSKWSTHWILAATKDFLYSFSFLTDYQRNAERQYIIWCHGLPPQQTPNKQYLSINVSKFMIDGFGLIHKQYFLPASTDLIQRKGNDKMKCLIVQLEPKQNICVRRLQRSVNTKYISEPLWRQTDTCLFFLCNVQTCLITWSWLCYSIHFQTQRFL